MAGDMFQAGVGHAFFQKQCLGSDQDGAAGLFGLFFGSAHGGKGESFQGLIWATECNDFNHEILFTDSGECN
jgi:hypothetical protein